MGIDERLNRAIVAMEDVLTLCDELSKELHELKKDTSKHVSMKDAKEEVIKDLFKNYSIGQEVWIPVETEDRQICTFCNGTGKVKAEGIDEYLRCPKCISGTIPRTYDVPRRAKISKIVSTQSKDGTSIRFHCTPNGGGTGRIQRKTELCKTEEQCVKKIKEKEKDAQKEVIS